MRVELAVFSGRPNPAWDLTAAERAGILGMVANLPPAPAREAPIGGLGYQGFVLEEEPGQAIGASERITVIADRVVKEVAGGVAVCCLDSERRVERALAESCKRHLEPVMYDDIALILEESGVRVGR